MKPVIIIAIAFVLLVPLAVFAQLIPEPTPELIPEPISEITPELIPELIPELTPEPISETTPKTTPELTEPESTCGKGTVDVNGQCVPEPIGHTMEEYREMTSGNAKEENGGGCLIATATFGSELAPQVQQLRELRDNTLLQTESGTNFMNIFNDVYYSFSPVIADYERENPVFKEAVKIAITPMISTLSIMTLAENGSEVEVLGLGISLIALNLGMYFVAPAMIIYKIRKFT